MRKQKERQLVLNKRTVARLDSRELKLVRGGQETGEETRCCTFKCTG